MIQALFYIFITSVSLFLAIVGLIGGEYDPSFMYIGSILIFVGFIWSIINFIKEIQMIQNRLKK